MKLDGIKILLVEDDNFIGDLFERKFRVEGAVCTRAMSGESGLQKLSANNYDFDIIITDLMMAKMDGYEMVREIKNIEKAKSIPVVVLTNRTSLNESTEKIVELEIDGLFIKSDTALSDLVDKITGVLIKRGVKS